MKIWLILIQINLTCHFQNFKELNKLRNPTITMVSSYPSKEYKVNKRLERLQELLMGHQVTDATFKGKKKQDSSKFQIQLEKWAKDFQILESEFSKLVQQLIRSN